MGGTGSDEVEVDQSFRFEKPNVTISLEWFLTSTWEQWHILKVSVV